MALVKRWKADGHLAAVMKDQGAIRAREVLERKANSSTRLAFCTDFPLARKLRAFGAPGIFPPNCQTVRHGVGPVCRC